MNRLASSKGFTLVEMFVAMGILVAMGALTSQAFMQYNRFQKIKTVRSQLNTEASACLQELLWILPQGRAKTVMISTPATSPLIPNSRIDFELAASLPTGTTAYAYYYEDGSLVRQTFLISGITHIAKIASNVESVVFGYPDTANAARITFTLRFAAKTFRDEELRLSFNNQAVTLLSN